MHLAELMLTSTPRLSQKPWLRL